MPKYKVTAKNLNNKLVKSVVDGKDEVDLRKRLRDSDLVLMSYKEIGDKTSGYKLKASDVAEFARQLASMLSSGITVVRAIEIVKDRDMKPNIRIVYTKLYNNVQSGLTLSEGMRAQGKAFPELFVNMIASGEASGQLENSMEKMAVHYDKENRLNKKIKGAMTYPMILAIFVVVVVLAIFIFVLPNLFSLFENMELPPITAFMMNLSSFLTANWLYVIIGTLVVIAAVKFLLAVPSIAFAADKAKLTVPKIGKMLKIIYTARFSRTLSSLYSSGLPMITALDISSTILGNRYIQSQFIVILKDVRNGEPLSDAFSRIDGFDKKLTTSILIGEESGRLDTMLQFVADSFDYESEMAIGRLVQMIEPIMLIVMALIVCTVMLAVMMGIMSVYTSIG